MVSYLLATLSHSVFRKEHLLSAKFGPMKTRAFKTPQLPHEINTDVSKSESKSVYKRQYKPIPSQKGLQCKGDQFDYVVEWEIHEEAEVSLLR